MEQGLQGIGTLTERERLFEDKAAKLTGFTPRSSYSLPANKLPPNKVPTKFRVSTDYLHQQHRPMEPGSPRSSHRVMYQLWLEAGKHAPPAPQKQDEQYNSNVWRNFRETCGYNTTADGRKVSDMIASLYPITIPPPSKIGQYTYTKFLKETPLINDPKFRNVIIQKTQQDLVDFHQMRLRSEARHPPLDQQGNILPPLYYKKYERFELPPVDDITTPVVLPPGETRVDIFGKRVPKLNHTPYLWKLSFKTNHPDIKKVQGNLAEKSKPIPRRKTAPV